MALSNTTELVSSSLDITDATGESHSYGSVTVTGNAQPVLGNVYNVTQHVYQMAADALLEGQKGKKPPDVMQVLKYDNMTVKRDFSMPKNSFAHDWVWKTSFKDWLGMPSKNPYWICGKPGSGKSTLVAYLVNHDDTTMTLRGTGDKYKIIWFFYDYRAGGALANSVDGMLRMFLYQLADQSNEVKERLQSIFEDNRLRLDSDENMLQVVCDVLKYQTDRFCIFIDGLDEYEGPLVHLMSTCKRILEFAPVKICISSRPDVPVSDEFADTAFPLYAEILMQNHNKESMHKYAHQEILCAQARLEFDVETRCTEALRADLISKAEGIILWFKLAFDELLKMCTQDEQLPEEEFQKFVDNVPDSLEGLYKRSLTRIPPRNRSEAALILYLVEKLRDLHEKVDEYRVTDLDHLAETYNFICDQVGGTLGLQKVESYTAMRIKLDSLLHGLLDCQELEYKDEEELPSASDLDVRYIHKTFQTYILKESDPNGGKLWVRKYVPDEVERLYPDDFWLRFFITIIEQAIDDGCFTDEELLEALREALWAMEAVDEPNMKHASKFLKRLVTRPRSYLFALMQDLCPTMIERLIRSIDSDDEEDRTLVSKVLIGGAIQMIKVNRRLTFPVAWKSRHAILRTALLLIGMLTQEAEEGGRQTYPYVSKVLKSRFGIVLSFANYGEKAAPRWLLDTTFGKDVRSIRDLVSVMLGNLPNYFSARITEEPLSPSENELLVRAYIGLALQEVEDFDAEEWMELLIKHGVHISNQSLCFFFRSTHCSSSDSEVELVSLLRKWIKVNPIGTGANQHLSNCQFSGKDNGLLLHWAQTSCDASHPDHESCKESDREEAYLRYLDLLILAGQDIHAKCYAGGTVLQALLDHSIQPASGRMHMHRKAKFFALIRRGLNPHIDTPRGRGLQTALDYASAPLWKRAPYLMGRVITRGYDDSEDVGVIVAFLRVFDAQGQWPEIEEMDVTYSDDEDDNDDEETKGEELVEDREAKPDPDKEKQDTNVQETEKE